MTGNAALDKILILVCLVFTLLTTGLSYYSFKLIKRPQIDEQAELESMLDESKQKSQIESVTLKKITINLHSRSSRLRYLDIQLNILPFHASQASLVTQKEPIIADAVINIAGDMDPDEINSVSGKIILENRIKTYINSTTKDPLIKKIFFSRFVIQ